MPGVAYTTKSAPPLSSCTATNCGYVTPLASVATSPVRASMVRMRLLAVSATKTVAPPTATLFGWLNMAALPTPFAEPDTVPSALPPPASVVTAPVESESTRISEFCASAM